MQKKNHSLILLAALAAFLFSSVSKADDEISDSEQDKSFYVKTTYPERVEDSPHYLRLIDSAYSSGDIDLNNNAVTNVAYSPLLKDNTHSVVNFEGTMAYYEGWEGDKYRPLNEGLMIANVVYRPTESAFKPYIGFGSGVRYIEFENGNNTDNYSGDLLPSYQLMSGFSYEKKGKGKTSVEFSLGYSYLASLNSKTYDTGLGESYKTDDHSVQGKILFKFH